MQRLLIMGYEMYKTEVEKAVPGSNIVIAPAGMAWSLVHDAVGAKSAGSGSAVPKSLLPGGSDTFKALYVEDDYHPSPQGTVLAALVLVETLLHLSSSSNPSQESSNVFEKLAVQADPAVSDTWVKFLQSVARTAATNDTSYFRSWIQQQTETTSSDSSETKLETKVSEREL